MKGRSLFVDLERKRRRKSKRRSNKRSIKKRVTRKSRRNVSNKKKKKLKGGAAYDNVVINGSIRQTNPIFSTEIKSTYIMLENLPTNPPDNPNRLYKESDQNGNFNLKITPGSDEDTHSQRVG